MPPLREPEDFTKDGKCSHCGGCCASILPLSDSDIKRLRKFAEDTSFTPKLPDGDDVIYLHCPFLADDPMTGKKRCRCYDVRPDVCRTFSCGNSNAGNAKAWLDAHPDTDMPDPVNAWSIFGRTGLRIQGREISYSHAPRCQVGTEDGGEYQFTVGRPIELLKTDGSRVTPSLVTGLSEQGIQLFNAAERRLELIPFGSIAQVLSRACILKEPAGTQARKDEDDDGTED